MIHPTPTKPVTSQRWQSRAEISKDHLDRLARDELRRTRPYYYWLRFGQTAWVRANALKFNPNQPRVPAGNPDGGQWTSEGTDQATDFSAVRRSNRVSIDYSRALTGISTIDDTTKALSKTLARAMERMDIIPEWTPQLYGTAVHVAFGTAVRLQGLPGIGFNDVEQSFNRGDIADFGELGVSEQMSYCAMKLETSLRSTT